MTDYTALATEVINVALTSIDLNNHVEFDVPFTVTPEQTVITNTPYHAPDVYDDDGELWISGREDWTPWDGYSRQEGYSGPVMHPSEFLGGQMAVDVLDNPGTYVLCTVADINDDDGDPFGWLLLELDNN